MYGNQERQQKERLNSAVRVSKQTQRCFGITSKVNAAVLGEQFQWNGESEIKKAAVMHLSTSRVAESS